jgi:hypothetical protein
MRETVTMTMEEQQKALVLTRLLAGDSTVAEAGRRRAALAVRDRAAGGRGRFGGP